MSIPKEVLAKYITPRTVFVETGTRWGDTLQRAVELGCRFAYSFESDAELAGIAIRRLKDTIPNYANWKVFKDNSVDGIVSLIRPGLLQGQWVFFLDAHTDKYSPVLGELEAIRLAYQWENCPIILVDDMRVFRAGHWDVTEDQIKTACTKINPEFKFSYERGVEENDILVASC